MNSINCHFVVWTVLLHGASTKKKMQWSKLTRKDSETSVPSLVWGYAYGVCSGATEADVPK